MYALLDFDGDIEASEGNSDVRPLVVGIPAFRLRLDTDPIEAAIPQELMQQIATTVLVFGDRWDTGLSTFQNCRQRDASPSLNSRATPQERQL
ncbi:MAG: hypothetical protein OXJ37_21655 [Bryobacterales bacterium]|nr:hypothetical protein [Bryobacterales bacterium]MDE0265023.1 hypothetical protein [Bryobacterales bacterium]